MKILKALGSSPVIAAILFLIGCVVLSQAPSVAQVWRWSQTAGSNSNADPNINWAVGMAPSAVSPSARQMMAAVAQIRDDWSGANATGGTASAYTLSSNQGFDTLAHLNGQKLCFTPNNTNATGATLSVDNLTAEPINTAPSTAIGAGVLVQGTPYCVVYKNADLAFYLVDFAGNPFNVPLGVLLDYSGASAPNSNFALAYGQCISRTTYAALFSLVSTTFSGCDGTSTFGLPDTRGRVIAGLDNLGGIAANRLTSATGCTMTSLGASCGNQQQTIAQANLPNLNFSVTGTASGMTATVNAATPNVNTSNPSGAYWSQAAPGNIYYNLAHNATMASDAVTISNGSVSGNAASGGSGSALTTVPPLLGLSKIIRIF